MATLTISPENEKKVKALGFLSNKGTDNFSARVITVNGKINAEQMACIAQAAEKFGNGIVTFTTRLTVEVQGVPFDKIEEFRTFIAQAGGWRQGEPGPKCGRLYPARVPLASTGSLTPSGCLRRFTKDFTKGMQG